MGLTSKKKDPSKLPPIEVRQENKRRLHMSKAEVLAEEKALADRKQKVKEYERALESGESAREVIGQDADAPQSASPANAAEISGSQSPLVKRRSRKATGSADNV